MAEVLALEHLYDAVVARFEDEAPEDTTPPPQSFGWREPARRVGARRIIWVPGDDSNGDLGELLAARQPGRNPRPLATLGELFTVYLEAQDSTDAEDERTQYRAARLLFDAWWRAVHLAAHGTVTIESASWVIEKTTRRFGATIRVLCSVQAMVPDAVYETAPEDVRAEIDVEQLDVTETFETAPAP